MIVSLGPIFTLVGGLIFLGESVSTSDVIQICLSFVAISFIALNSLQDQKEMEGKE